MGRSKQLLPLGPKPVIRHCLDSVIAAGITDLVVVLGAGSDEIRAAIDGMPVKTAYNREPRSDMAESVRLGLREVDAASTGVLVCLSDHPLVSSETVRSLVKVHAEHPGRIIIPFYKGRRGHPTLFPRTIIRDILNDKTLRDVITDHAEVVRAVEVDDEGVVLDMDTPQEYDQILKRFVTGSAT
jgi:CTP:molybdopterin cytidylyltransferase MocA